jgi:hypothetical protein
MNQWGESKRFGRVPLAEKMVTPDRKRDENRPNEPNPRHASRLKLWEPEELPQRLELTFVANSAP